MGSSSIARRTRRRRAFGDSMLRSAQRQHVDDLLKRGQLVAADDA